MKVKTIVVNGILAALYIAVTAIISPFGFTNIQFRVSEMFNHLVVFNKKYIFGIVIGVFVSNLVLSSSLGIYDIVFGVTHSVICLSITILSAKFIKSIWKRMILNTAVFTVMMFIIAIELNIVLKFPFLFTWFTTAVSEFVVMIIGVPLMLALNKRLNFKKLL